MTAKMMSEVHGNFICNQFVKSLHYIPEYFTERLSHPQNLRGNLISVQVIEFLVLSKIHWIECKYESTVIAITICRGGNLFQSAKSL